MYKKEHATLIGYALRAQAIADAIGEDFEFCTDISPDEIQDALQSDKVIHITDDTQMTMFGLEAMIHGGVSKVPSFYTMWRLTQMSKAPFYLAKDSGLLIDDINMWQIRAPGNTCLSSILEISRGHQADNNSDGCGTVMKALPFLFHEDCMQLIDVSLLTHLGPQVVPAATLQWKYAQHLIAGNIHYLHKGKQLSDVYGDGGWRAKSCLDIAIWAFENCEGDFEKMLDLAIRHDGDSDSVAATAGVFYGLYYKQYPAKLYDRVYEKDTIDSLIKRIEDTAI
jgi:ADP-ribosylglycohydrolase